MRMSWIPLSSHTLAYLLCLSAPSPPGIIYPADKREVSGLIGSPGAPGLIPTKSAPMRPLTPSPLLDKV